MFSNRRPYYGLKLSIADFFREPVRYLKQSNTQESMMEKPYLIDEYPKMHLSLPDFKFKPKYRPGLFGQIASGAPFGGLAIIDYGDAKCWWDLVRTSNCINEPVTITIAASYFWTEEFGFDVGIIEDTVGATLTRSEGAEARSWDEQDYILTFPSNSNGAVTVCGSASTNTLVSQTFETVMAGMPVGINLSGGSLVASEHGQQNPAVLLKSSYGTKGADCGCITIETSCDPCVGVVDIEWDIGASAETIAQNRSASIAVQDGLGPYNWQVSGTGVSLQYAQTAGVNNTLIADGTACGGIDVTVTDQCGSTSGYVKCTTGSWHYCSSVLVAACSSGNCYGTDCSHYCGSGTYKKGAWQAVFHGLASSCNYGDDPVGSCGYGSVNLTDIVNCSAPFLSFPEETEINRTVKFYYWGCW